MTKVKNASGNDIFELIEQATSDEDLTPWNGSLREYLPMVLEYPYLNELAHARICRMVEHAGIEFEDEEKNKNPHYKFFEKELFGIDPVLAQIMEYFRGAATGSEVGRRILLLWGPTSSGKSQFAIMLKKGLEKFTRTWDGRVYAIDGCPMHENPLNAIPWAAREQLREEYNLNIEGELCPRCSYILENELNGEYWNIPVKRVFFSEMNRIGVGTFQPGDTKCTKGNTKILTNVGLVNIEDLESFVGDDGVLEGIEVIREDGTKTKATNFFKYSNKEIVNIRTELNYEISVTYNHPLMTVNNDGEFIWKEAGLLSVGDTLVLGKGNSIFNFEEIQDNSLGLKWSRELAWIFGMFVAEGSYRRNTVEIANYSDDVKKRVQDFAKKIGATFIVRPERITFNSKQFVEFLKVCGFSTGAHNKLIPEIIFSSGEFIIDFLRGMWYGDGNLGRHKTKNTNDASYSTVSHILASQTRLLLLTLGIPASLYSYPNVGTSGSYTISVRAEFVEKLQNILQLPDWKITRDLTVNKFRSPNTLRIPKIDSLIKRAYNRCWKDTNWYPYIGKEASRFSKHSLTKFIEDAKRNDVSKTLINRLEEINNENIFYVDVKEISNDTGDVYDIEVPNKHYFIANGFISHNSQSQSELTGSVNFAKLEEHGVESHPLAYNFDGELNVSNRGMMEFIELLKVDPKFRHILLTLSQEKRIKVERFPLIYADLVPVAHSVTGDTPIPYRDYDIIKHSTMQKLCDSGNTNIEVLATNSDGDPVWAKVKGFHKHAFTGNLIRTIQCDGVVETTYNHSIIGKNIEPFYPETMKDVLYFREIPECLEMPEFVLNFPSSLEVVKNKLYVKPTGNKKSDGEFGKYGVQFCYRCDSQESYDILKVLAWFITEGHVNEAHAIISQNSVESLKNIKHAVEKISSTTASLQDRSDKPDKTSRLHLSAKVWRDILEINCGKHAENKRLPNFVFNLPKKMKKYLINEMIDGDGSRNCVHPSSEDYKNNYFRYKTTSKMLASQVGFLLSQLDVDYNVSFSYTKSGKEAYEIRFRHKKNDGNRKNRIEKTYVENIMVYDIECEDNHSFTCGVGNVVCHNTNETEFSKFLAKKEEEALHDRVIIIEYPYNLKLNEEIEICKKLIKQSVNCRGTHIAPHTLEIAAMFAVLSRLEEPRDRSITLLQKMRLYNGESVEGFTAKQIKDLQELSDREGLDGISPRYIVNRMEACIAKHGVDTVTPIAAIRSIEDGLPTNAKLGKDDIERCKNLTSLCIEEYTKIACNEVQKAFFLNFEHEIKNLLKNYLDNVEAYLNDEKLENEWGELVEPNEKLMRSIEEKVEVTNTGKDSFREEVCRKMLKSKEKTGDYDYQSHVTLKEALQKQLFDERKDVIRLTVSTRSPDPEGLKKINEVVKVLCDEYGYNAESANELLRYVSEIMAAQ